MKKLKGIPEEKRVYIDESGTNIINQRQKICGFICGGRPYAKRLLHGDGNDRLMKFTDNIHKITDSDFVIRALISQWQSEAILHKFYLVFTFC